MRAVGAFVSGPVSGTASLPVSACLIRGFLPFPFAGSAGFPHFTLLSLAIPAHSCLSLEFAENRPVFQSRRIPLPPHRTSQTGQSVHQDFSSGNDGLTEKVP